MAAGKPVCLCGPVGCGKTALVQHLSLITGKHINHIESMHVIQYSPALLFYFLNSLGHTLKNRFYQVQLGEEMDSKLLLGTYKCTDIPGEFIWQAGVLTKVEKFV